MRPASFEYYRAQGLEHALDLLARFGDDCRPLAGGQSLVPMMNLRLARPGHLIDINDLPLNGIELTGSGLRVGALVRHAELLADPNIEKHYPAFREAVHWIGHPTIRRHGTFGGSVSHADPTAELAAISVLYDAVIVARSASGERRIPAVEFFRSAFVTALEPGEMVVAAEFPLPPPDASGGFIEFAERRGDFATAAIGFAVEIERQTIARASLVCSGAELTPIRAPGIERLLVGRPLQDPGAMDAGRALAASVDPPTDHVADAEYRKRLIGELARRVIAETCSKALQGS